MVTATGWTYEYIDEHIDLPRLEALTRHWARRPPVHVGVAYLCEAHGIEWKAGPDPARSKPVDERERFEAARAQTAALFPTVPMDPALRQTIKSPEDALRASLIHFYGSDLQ